MSATLLKSSLLSPRKHTLPTEKQMRDMLCADFDISARQIPPSSRNDLALAVASDIGQRLFSEAPPSSPISPKIESGCSSPLEQPSQTYHMSDSEDDDHRSDDTCDCFACQPCSQPQPVRPDFDLSSSCVSNVSSPITETREMKENSPSIESDHNPDDLHVREQSSDDKVTHKSLQDPDLQGSYDNLPPLRYTKLVSSLVDADIPGFFDIGSWKELLPENSACIEKIKDAILFRSAAHYVNPSRADPKNLTLKAYRRGLFVVDRSSFEKLAIAVTTGCCMESRIVYGRVRVNADMTSSIYKMVRLVPHTQEFQRFAGFIGEMYDTQACNAPCYCNRVLTFATSAAPYDGDCVPDSRLRRYLKEKLLPRQRPFPSKSADMSTSTPDIIMPILNAASQIPIYDAREANFTLSDNIQHVARLPLYKRGAHEIPVGSCITVGHTISMIADTNDRDQDYLTLNVHWIILWAVPSSQIF